MQSMINWSLSHFLLKIFMLLLKISILYIHKILKKCWGEGVQTSWTLPSIDTAFIYMILFAKLRRFRFYNAINFSCIIHLGSLFHSRTRSFIIWVIAVLKWGVDMLQNIDKSKPSSSVSNTYIFVKITRYYKPFSHHNFITRKLFANDKVNVSL
jgi:hypothetical protein